MKDQIATLLTSVLKEMGIPGVVPEVEIPEDASHGDYTTNVAMKVVSRQSSVVSPFRSPMEIALSVKEAISYQLSAISQKNRDQNIGKRGHPVSSKLSLSPILQAVDRVEVAPPGFINIFLTEASLSSNLVELLKQKEGYGVGQSSVVSLQSSVKSEDGKLKTDSSLRVMVEYAHPNTHKAFHIGHLRNITTGESIIRLLESQGNEVIRANYQGDVGMHIAKALWALLYNAKCKMQNAKLHTIQEKVEFLGKAYAAGSKAFEEDEAAKEEIGEINKKIYAKDPVVYELYRETRQWSLDYFEAIYRRVGSHFDRYYFESEMYEQGKKLVRAGRQKGIFEESDGAIIFPGEKYGLHNRVFITGEGNATYEGKELALATMETTEHGKIDRIIHVVGPEQASFFQVTFQAEELLGIVKPGVQYHLVYGWVKLKHGKMSSRSGNVVLGEWLLDEAKKAIYSILDKNTSKGASSLSSDPLAPLDPLDSSRIAEKAAVAAVKYAFLKVGTTSEIAFDIKESVNFQGDSGPYLQYTYARCKSVLRKAPKSSVVSRQSSDKLIADSWKLNVEERAVARLLIHFPDVVAGSAEHLSPSTLCTYLFKLAQAYNLFYAKHTILGEGKRKTENGKLGIKSLQFTVKSLPLSLRLSLTAATA